MKWFFPLLLLAGSIPAEELALFNPKISRSEGGTPVPAWYQFGGGDKVHLSFLISGFQSTAEEHAVALDYEVQAVDPQGTPLAPASTGEVKVELAPEGKDWRPPVRYEIILPETPLSGKHAFEIVIRDRVAGTELRTEIPFEVKSAIQRHPVAFTIQDFRFYRAETDTQGITGEATFRPGQQIWARFALAGYKFGPGNQYDVRYGVQVRDASGRLIFEEPNAAAESSKSFYPKHRVSGAVAVTLDQKNRPGDYVLVISAIDAVGGQQTTGEYPFRLE